MEGRAARRAADEAARMPDARRATAAHCRRRCNAQIERKIAASRIIAFSASKPAFTGKPASCRTADDSAAESQIRSRREAGRVRRRARHRRAACDPADRSAKRMDVRQTHRLAYSSPYRSPPYFAIARGACMPRAIRSALKTPIVLASARRG
ncbi:hypothetical protein WS69_07220 [Burkholderia sp. BDU5]|nr:hypothetical protein WS69_07220 [Burkholderia sp. BDU5]